MFRFIVKLSVRAIVRDIILEGVNVKNIKNRLKDVSSRAAPAAPAKENERNFFLSPIF